MNDLLVELLRFFKTVVNDKTILNGAVYNFYKGSIRVILMFLYDWPHFFTKFYLSLCEEVHEAHIQIKNIILSCIPQKLQVISPFPQPNLINVPCLLSLISSFRHLVSCLWLLFLASYLSSLASRTWPLAPGL